MGIYILWDCEDIFEQSLIDVYSTIQKAMLSANSVIKWERIDDTLYGYVDFYGDAQCKYSITKEEVKQ